MVIFAIILCAVIAAVLIGGGVVFLADRFAARNEEKDDPEPVPVKRRSAETPAAPEQSPTAIRITTSPGRKCLLAFKQKTTAASGAAIMCSCMRDNVCLWEIPLNAPLMQFVSDEGCAIFFDRLEDTMQVEVRTIDVAGIERFKETFPLGFLEYGGDISGEYVWAVSEGSEGFGELVVWSLEQGSVVLRCPDPRLEDKDVNGNVTSLFVQGDCVLVQYERGRGFSLAIAGESGIQRPGSEGPGVGII